MERKKPERPSNEAYLNTIQHLVQQQLSLVESRLSDLVTTTGLPQIEHFILDSNVEKVTLEQAASLEDQVFFLITIMASPDKEGEVSFSRTLDYIGKGSTVSTFSSKTERGRGNSLAGRTRERRALPQAVAADLVRALHIESETLGRIHANIHPAFQALEMAGLSFVEPVPDEEALYNLVARELFKLGH